MKYTFKKANVLLMVLCLMLTILSTSTLASEVVGARTGESTPEPEEYLEIYTAEELYNFATQVNAGETALNGKLMADIVVNENVLNADGTLNGDGSNFRVWTPIGVTSNAYEGTFDGNGKTISGLYLDDINRNDVGLFSKVASGGVVQNVGVVDSYLRGKENVGAIVGHTYSSAIINCFNAGTTRAFDYAGGLAGRTSFSTVENCYNMGKVIAGNKCGGVVADAQEGAVSNCYNMGKVDATDDVGGIVGNILYTNVSNCYNTGKISGIDNVGGVVGNNTYGTVGYCYNTGDIRDCYQNVGGVVGSNGGNVSNCYNTGDIIGSTYIGGGNTQALGGVVGHNEHAVTNCYNTGNVSGASYVGGVVGYDFSAILENCFYISGCAQDGAEVTQFGVGAWRKGSSTADEAGKTTGVTVEQVAFGEVCFLLQGEQDKQIWGQNIGVDSYPVFSQDKVYCITEGDAILGYSNQEDELPNLGATVSGTITSYLTDGEVTIELVCDGQVSYSIVVNGKEATYAIDGVAAGDYMVRISKENHVTREYTVTVDWQNVVFDGKVCPVGDVTGDGMVNIKDFQRLLRHVNKTNLLTDYALSCGDVTDDGSCNIKDFQRLLRHVNKTSPLF